MSFPKIDSSPRLFFLDTENVENSASSRGGTISSRTRSTTTACDTYETPTKKRKVTGKTTAVFTRSLALSPVPTTPPPSVLNTPILTDSMRQRFAAEAKRKDVEADTMRQRFAAEAKRKDAEAEAAFQELLRKDAEAENARVAFQELLRKEAPVKSRDELIAPPAECSYSYANVLRNNSLYEEIRAEKRPNIEKYHKILNLSESTEEEDESETINLCDELIADLCADENHTAVAKYIKIIILFRNQANWRETLHLCDQALNSFQANPSNATDLEIIKATILYVDDKLKDWSKALKLCNGIIETWSAVQRGAICINRSVNEKSLASAKHLKRCIKYGPYMSRTFMQYGLLEDLKRYLHIFR